MINTKRPNTSDYIQVGFIEAKDTQGNYQNIDHIYDSQGNIVFQQGYLNEYQGADNFSIPAIGKPLLDYTIYGNMSQASGVSPTTPIQPQETGERTRNLFDKDNVVFSGFYPHADTGAVVNTTSGKLLSIIVPCEPNTSYTWSFDRIVADLRNRVAGYSTYPTVGMACTFLDRETDSPSGSTRTIQKFTTTANTHWLILMVTGTGQTAETLTEDVAENAQLEIGTEMTAYEPYGYKIPISSASTTTPIFLGEVPTTRRIKKLVLDGTENWLVLDVYYTVSAPNVRPWGGCICTHCAYSGIIGGNSNTRLWVKQASFPDCQTLGDFKSYLAAQYAAGTPVTVWYSTAEPETGIVNEPLRKIGDYADTLSMEQAGVSIPTVKGNTVIDVLTEVEPSEVDVTYRGSTKPKYNLFLAQNGDSFEAKDGQSLYIGGGL